MKIKKDLLEICKRFNECGVKYVVCGAYACKLHEIEKVSGQVRFTQDYDFIVDSSAENMKQIKEALKDVVTQVNELKDNELVDYQTVKLVGKSEIDLIRVLWQVDYAVADKEKIIKKIEGVKIPVLSIEALIETKKDSIRERDKADVYWLKKIKETK